MTTVNDALGAINAPIGSSGGVFVNPASPALGNLTGLTNDLHSIFVKSQQLDIAAQTPVDNGNGGGGGQTTTPSASIFVDSVFTQVQTQYDRITHPSSGFAVVINGSINNLHFDLPLLQAAQAQKLRVDKIDNPNPNLTDEQRIAAMPFKVENGYKHVTDTNTSLQQAIDGIRSLFLHVSTTINGVQYSKDLTVAELVNVLTFTGIDQFSLNGTDLVVNSLACQPFLDKFNQAANSLATTANQFDANVGLANATLEEAKSFLSSMSKLTRLAAGTPDFLGPIFNASVYNDIKVNVFNKLTYGGQ